MRKHISEYEGVTCELIDATAIAKSADDTERQYVTLLHRIDSPFDPCDLMIYYWPYDPQASLEDISDDDSRLSSYWEDLETVLIDGKPLDYYGWK